MALPLREHLLAHDLLRGALAVARRGAAPPAPVTVATTPFPPPPRAPTPAAPAPSVPAGPSLSVLSTIYRTLVSLTRVSMTKTAVKEGTGPPGGLACREARILFLYVDYSSSQLVRWV